VRICRSPKVFARPDPVEDAIGFCDSLVKCPNAIVVSPGERHWEIFTALCRRTGARGNLVPDAWLAALAIESGCELITTDRDFARFEGLRWRPPF
jgi:toxin-antitoxin system PIN domain toxin